jgi:serine protease Do
MNKNRYRAVLAAIALTLCAAPAMAADPAAIVNPPEVKGGLPGMIGALLPTVVNITARIGDAPQVTASATPGSLAAAGNPQAKLLTGSGFIIDESGLIVTNYHVIDNAYEITVGFSDGQRAVAKLVGAVRVCDIAVLKVEVNRKLPAAAWGDSDKLLIGEPVFAVGNPLGIGLSVSSGVVSAVNRNIMDTPYDDFIQTDAAINHGNSGGPLFNMDGEVIGIDTAIISPTTGSVGLGFAIPANDARGLVAQLMQYGWARPGWLGLKVDAVTPDIADALSLPSPAGSIVTSVSANSPAARAGLVVGDVITRIDGTAPTDERALMRHIAKSPIGVVLALSVRRANQDLTLAATTAEWPRQDWDARNAPTTGMHVQPTVPPDLGLSLAALTDASRARYGLASSQTGVLLAGVAGDTDAADRGLAEGDVILSVQNTAVTTGAEVQAQLAQARADHRAFVLLLVLPKATETRAPRFVALRLAAG